MIKASFWSSPEQEMYGRTFSAQFGAQAVLQMVLVGEFLQLVKTPFDCTLKQSQKRNPANLRRWREADLRWYLHPLRFHSCPNLKSIRNSKKNDLSKKNENVISLKNFKK